MTTTRPARLTASAGGSGALPRRTVVSAGAATAVGLALWSWSPPATPAS